MHMTLLRPRLASCLAVLCLAALSAHGQRVAADNERIGALERRQREQGVHLDRHDSQISAVEQQTKNIQERTTGIESKVNSAQEQVAKAAAGLKALNVTSGVTRRDLDRFWVLLAAMLVFFMQAGFKCLEVGMARRHHDATIGLMNLMNWLVLCIVFYCVGFGLMFGASFQGLIGTSLFFPNASQVQEVYNPLGMEFLLFQLAFAGTAATIVDGALAERTALMPYFIGTCFTGLLVYPVFCHWAWNQAGWLAKLKFHDFAGSTVVHSIGAWIALVGVYFVGPRRLRFSGPQRTDFEPYSVGYAVLGVIMLWFGWWGFNGGSKLRYDEDIASIILNTNLAGAAAGIIAYLHAVHSDRFVFEKIIGGVLGGLVAITASCDVVQPVGALLIGATAGIVHNYAYEWLLHWKIDDVAGAIPVHGACGVWGTLCAGLAVWWGQKDGSPTPVLIQVVGIAAALVYATGVSWVIFWLVEKLMGLRMSVAEEDGGLVDSNLGFYDGNLHVSVLRRLGFWSRFHTFPSYMRMVQNLAPAPREARVQVARALENRRAQFIREDGTLATREDVAAALDRFFS